MSAKLTVGSDPELIIQDRDGRYRSSIGIIKGTKEHKVDLGNGHYAFCDNVLLEMNVSTAYSKEDFISKMGDCLRRVNKLVRPHYRLVPQASAIYDAKETEHPDANVFGCDAEYCCYEMAQLNPPTCEPGNNFRSAGGHIHLGFTEEAYPLLAKINGEDRNERDWGRIWVVRMMDLFVGLPSLFVDHDKTSAARRKLYGKAGTHRPKEDYGVEYRATSNFWLHSPRLARLVYDLSEFVVDFTANRKYEEMWSDTDNCQGYEVSKLRKAIDTSNIEEAKELMEKVVKKYLPNSLYAEIFKLSEPTHYDFYVEWNIL